MCVIICLILCEPMDCSPPLSMGFSRQEYCSGSPFPTPEDTSAPRDRITSPALAGRFFATSATWEV